MKIMTGHHYNHDEMNVFHSTFIMKIMTSLIYHIQGDWSESGCAPNQKAKQPRIASDNLDLTLRKGMCS